MAQRSTLLYFSTFLLLLSTNVNAGPNVLQNTWISCSDNDRTINAAGTVELNSECLYQEITAEARDELELVCQTRTANFTSAQLAFSDTNFRQLSTSSDNTNSSRTLRINPGRAPQNTRYAVATLFSDSLATMRCTLSDPNTVQEPLTETQATAGECIDSDNDGFGWNGLATCTPDNNQPDNSSPAAITIAVGECLDSDGDGYGWNGVASCRVSNGGSTTTTGTGVVRDTITPPGFDRSNSDYRTIQRPGQYN